MNSVADMKAYVQAKVGTISAVEVLKELNLAWSTLYGVSDIPNSLATIFVRPASGTQNYITLPGFVGRVQGVRFSNWGPTIRLMYPTNYFSGTGPRWQSMLEWRSVDEVPTSAEIQNIGPVTLSVPAPLADDLEVTIIGQAAGASRARETVTLPAGERSVESATGFGPILDSITKTVYAAKDVTLTDKDGNEIAVLGAAETQTRYIEIKFSDSCGNYIDFNCQCFEVLYKKRAQVLWFDEDTIPAPYHVTVQNAAVASILAGRSSDGDMTRAAAFAGISAQSATRFAQDQLRGTDVRVITGPNNMYTQWSGHL